MRYAVTTALLLLSTTIASADGGALDIANPRCEYRHNPLGIATPVPRLSWELVARDESARDLHQTGYQILAATDPALLKEGHTDLWDSGKVASSASAQIEYAGAALASKSRVYWTVRSWDGNAAPSEWSPVQQFSIGLLQQSDWKAQWIGNSLHAAPPLDNKERAALRALPWLRLQAPIVRAPQSATFTGTIELPQEPISTAWFAGTADQTADLSINGTRVGGIARWEPVTALDIKQALRSGKNSVELAVTQQDGFPPAATGSFVIIMQSGAEIRTPLGAAWEARVGAQAAKAEVTPRLEWGGNRNTEHFMAPASYLRKTFASEKQVRRATLFSTALGVYWCEINGVPICNDELTPGWTEFSKRVYHQTYDVTRFLNSGENTIGAVLGDGWYAGLMGYTGRRNFYGGQPRFLAQLEIEYADGSRQTITTDDSWRMATGPIVHNDNYMGSSYDSRLEIPGWSTPGFDASGWTAPQVGHDEAPPRQADVTSVLRAMLKDNALSTPINPKVLGDPAYGVVKSLTVQYSVGGVPHTLTTGEGQTLSLPAPGETGDLNIIKATFGEQSKQQMLIEPQPGEPVRQFEKLTAQAVTEPLPGHYVVDLGQNMVGYVRLKIKGTPGQRLTLRHAEMLNPDGTIYTSNLRGATATDFLTLNGADQTIEPKFTFHGFRYVEITGLAAKPDLSSVTGIVLHTDMDRSAAFECSNELVNQLYHNIIWGQKGNYLEVPTDCPQRDERLGWTGDAQFFVNTAAYNFDIASFMSRWLKTLAHDAQFEDGTFAHVAPKVNERGGSTAWGDAAVVCTYAMYQRYGDLRLVRENYEPITRYLAWLESKTSEGISHVGGFSDWLNLDDATNKDLIDTAYRIELLRITAEMAKALYKPADAAAYSAARETARSAFARRFVAPDGSLRESGQTGYALAYTMNLLPREAQASAAQHFAQTIERKQRHLATGFIGTPRLLPALHAAGRDDLAYQLLLNTDYPSWLYQVKLGATTMWERWDGWTPERGFQDVGMNSFNHYAFGSVGDYLMGAITGIQPGHTAYAAFTLAPTPGPGLDFARTSYHSLRGGIRSGWKRVPGGIEFDFTVPPNTTARVSLPGTRADLVTENRASLHQVKGVSQISPATTGAEFTLGSGTYHFFAGQATH